MEPGDDDAVDLVGRELRVLQRRAPGPLAERHVLDLAEAVLPELRAHVAGRPPAVDELAGRAARAQELGDDRARGVVADEDRRRAVAAGRLVATAGQAGPDVGGDDQRGPLAPQRQVQRTDARAHRGAEVDGGDIGVEAQGRVDRGRVRAVRVGRRAGREEEQLGIGGRAVPRETGRLDAHRRRVLVVRGDAAGALPAAGADEGADLRTVEAPVGDVATRCEDAAHARQATARAAPAAPAVPGSRSSCSGPVDGRASGRRRPRPSRDRPGPASFRFSATARRGRDRSAGTARSAGGGAARTRGTSASRETFRGDRVASGSLP